jgi:hypothetical protein
MSWEQSDAVAFRDYLLKHRANLFAHMDSIAPVITITEKSTVDGIALSGAFKEGYLKAVETLKQLSIVERKQDDASSSGFTAM